VAPATQRGVEATGEFLLVFVRIIDLEVGRRGVVEDQIDIEAEQVGRPEEYGALDLFRPDGEEKRLKPCFAI
jgi:hypothetical protein